MKFEDNTSELHTLSLSYQMNGFAGSSQEAFDLNYDDFKSRIAAQVDEEDEIEEGETEDLHQPDEQEEQHGEYHEEETFLDSTEIKQDGLIQESVLVNPSSPLMTSPPQTNTEALDSSAQNTGEEEHTRDTDVFQQNVPNPQPFSAANIQETASDQQGSQSQEAMSEESEYSDIDDKPKILNEDMLSESDVKELHDNTMMGGGAGEDSNEQFGTDEADLMCGDDDDDIIKSADGDDTIFGGGGADCLFGEDGNDKLFGEAGDDWLFGGAGDDNITGGLGDDVLHGDAGNDTFIFSENEGNDCIFGGDGNDTLDVSGTSWGVHIEGVGDMEMKEFLNSDYASGGQSLSGYIWGNGEGLSADDPKANVVNFESIEQINFVDL